MLPKTTSLLFAPTNQVIEAQIVDWNSALANQVHQDWWEDADLLDRFDPQPIDRRWNWDELDIEIDGRALAATRVAVITGDGAAQGAMMISMEPVASILNPSLTTLFIELLFTAPRNRVALRRDHEPYIVGVGQTLLSWGGKFSQERGHGGRLQLDGSPDFITWYEKRGLQKLPLKPRIFEGVSYAPMELSEVAAQRLIMQLEGTGA